MPGKNELLDEIYAIQSGVKSSNVCVCCKALREADWKMSKALEVALADPNVNGSTIGKWLRSKEIRCSDYSIRRHRRGECRS